MGTPKGIVWPDGCIVVDHGKAGPCGRTPIQNRANGWCNAHDSYARRHGMDPQHPAPVASTICDFGPEEGETEPCIRIATANGKCAMHNGRVKHGYNARKTTTCEVPIGDGICGRQTVVRAGVPYKNFYGGDMPAVPYNLCYMHQQRKDPFKLSVSDGNINWQEDILPTARRVVESYTDTKVTKRQLHYQLTMHVPPLPDYINTTSMYDRMCHITALARRAGKFPRTFDRTRTLWTRPYRSGLDDAIEHTADSYGLDRTEGQEKSVYLIVEKAGLLEQLESWFLRYGIKIASLNGYVSQSFCETVAENVRADGRPAVLLYVGDFDCEGVDIDRDFIKRTNEWLSDADDISTGLDEDADEDDDEDEDDNGDNGYEGACWSEVRRVALTQEQVAQYNLPQSIGKMKSTRMPDFKRKYHTTMQVEVDALSPTVLRDLIQHELDDLIDMDTYRAVLTREDKDKEVLSRLTRINIEESTKWLARADDVTE